METKRQQQIFWIILKDGPIGISSILSQLPERISTPTLNRDLLTLKQNGFILTKGNGPTTRYQIDQTGIISAEINVDEYFDIEIDQRKIIEKYNSSIIEELGASQLFTSQEIDQLNKWTTRYHDKTKSLSEFEYRKEFERLMIELSWKSSQIEGNTYNLLDTEQLLKFNIKSEGHSEEEATMLLNHKSAINYTHEHKVIFRDLTLTQIVDIHTLLTKELGISKLLRNRLVRITGTRYTPPDNQFVIEEGINKMCQFVNSIENPFEKALRLILLISYLQPFDDGNKRTARLVGNAMLMSYDLCPLSYRSVTPAVYKKSLLLFYELNNVRAFKKIFIEQYQFAVENYF
jgi:hypothetical protein